MNVIYMHVYLCIYIQIYIDNPPFCLFDRDLPVRKSREKLHGLNQKQGIVSWHTCTEPFQMDEGLIATELIWHKLNLTNSGGFQDFTCKIISVSVSLCMKTSQTVETRPTWESLVALISEHTPPIKMIICHSEILKEVNLLMIVIYHMIYVI